MRKVIRAFGLIIVQWAGQILRNTSENTEELSKRGINLTAKAHRPQDLKYCKKIINLVSNDSVCSAITDEDDIINTGYAERRLVRKKLERAIKQ